MHNKKLIQVIAIVLAVLLAGGMVFSALFSALAEQPTEVSPERNQCELTVEYLTEEQALHITQRLIYFNKTDHRLEEVVFYAAGNLFRRQSAQMYEDQDLEKVFFEGYAPAGIDLRSVRLDGEPTDFGFRGEDEIFLRAACDLAPGGRCAFEFDYYLLLMRCGAFQGAGDTDMRLSAFCFVPAVYDPALGDFNLKRPLAHTRWLYCDAADYRASVTLPAGWTLCATGTAAMTRREGETALWQVEADNVRDFTLSFGRRWRVSEQATASGVRVRALTNVRGAGRRMLSTAVSAVEQCEAWFGPMPVRELSLAQSDYPLGALAFPGVVWLSGDLLNRSSADALNQKIRFCVAQQYFGLSAYPEPSADAWLSDSVCAYVACLLLEAEKGRETFLAQVNRDWVSALGQTVPGGLRITSDASRFDAYAYDILVLNRGAVVLHELRLAMGLEPLLAGLRRFYGIGADGHTLTEMEFVRALDEASGESWEAFLTDWLFNVDEYVSQDLDWYE